MSQVPHDPELFFTEWLAQSFEGLPGFAEQSARGAVVFQVGTRDPVSVRATQGKLEITRSVPADVIVQVNVAESDFVPVMVQGAELVSQAEPERRLMVLKALSLDEERIAGIREVRGSLAFVLQATGGEHRVVLTPGNAPPELVTPQCTVRCQLADFLALQRGETNPFELMMNGKIQISGDAQIPMALSSLLM